MKNPSLVVTVCHHSASLVMPIGDPRDGLFNPIMILIVSFEPPYIWSIQRNCRMQTKYGRKDSSISVCVKFLIRQPLIC